MSLSIYFISIFLGLAGGLFYVLKVNKTQNNSTTQLLILGLIVFVASFELFAIHLANSKRPNLIVYNICFVYLETFLMLGYLYTIFSSVKIKRSIIYFSLGYLIWGILNIWLIQDIWKSFHNYSYFFASLGIVTFSLLLIFGISKNNLYLDRPLTSIPHFWNCSVILIFYSSGFLYILSANFLVGLDPWFINILGSFNRLVAGTMYLVFGFSYYATLLQPASYAK